MKYSDLTDNDKESVINEMSERLKDVVFMESKNKVAEALSKLPNYDLNSFDTITIEYAIEFVWGDVIQIIGKNRRD